MTWHWNIEKEIERNYKMSNILIQKMKLLKLIVHIAVCWVFVWSYCNDYNYVFKFLRHVWRCWANSVVLKLSKPIDNDIAVFAIFNKLPKKIGYKSQKRLNENWQYTNCCKSKFRLFLKFVFVQLLFLKNVCFTISIAFFPIMLWLQR